MTIERYNPDWYFKKMLEEADGKYINYKTYIALVGLMSQQLNTVQK